MPRGITSKYNRQSSQNLTSKPFFSFLPDVVLQRVQAQAGSQGSADARHRGLARGADTRRTPEAAQRRQAQRTGRPGAERRRCRRWTRTATESGSQEALGRFARQSQGARKGEFCWKNSLYICLKPRYYCTRKVSMAWRVSFGRLGSSTAVVF